jgi:hypothetical protein
VNSDVGRDWCVWISGILCALGSHLFFYRYQCPEMGDGLFLFSSCLILFQFLIILSNSYNT